MKAVDIELQKVHLKPIEHAALQEKICSENRRKRTSRRSIHKGGPSAKVGDLREKKAIRDQVGSAEALRNVFLRRSTRLRRNLKNEEYRLGRTRKQDSSALRSVPQNNELPRPEDLLPVREPDRINSQHKLSIDVYRRILP